MKIKTKVILIIITMVALTMVLAFQALYCQPSSSHTVVVPQGVEDIRPIADLGDGWWLVEVTLQYECDNPFPIGQRTTTLDIPHLIRMTQTELEYLTNETRATNIPVL